MAGRGKGAFRIAIEDFLETFGFEDILFTWYSGLLEKLEDSAIDVYRKTAEMMYPGKNFPPGFAPDELSVVVKSAQNGFWVWVLAMAGLIFGGFMGYGQASARLANQYMDSQLRTYRADPGTLLALRLRELMDKGEIELSLNDLGIPEILKEPLQKLGEFIPSPMELTILRVREKIDETTYQREMKLQGVTPERIEQMLALYEVIPAPTDLISMAVREAFDPAIVKKFGYHEDYPDELTEWAEKQGLSKEWAERYWYAHWQLPSPLQVFEMFHRLRPGTTDTPVDEDTLSEYLRIADIAPFWRDRLKAIAYNPYTRVDVRRMFKVGTLDDSQVLDSYLDLGYDPEKAQAMTEFTIAYATEEETGIVRSSVQRAYSSGMIDRSTADSMLSESGYDETSRSFYLDAIDFDQALDINQLKLRNIRKRYVEGVIDETTVSGEIALLNLPSERVNVLLELWNTERESKTMLPTTSQTEKFYEMDIITDTDFREVFRLRGYTDKTIDWTLARIDLETLAATQKEAERALSDVEKARKSKTSTQYQKDRATYDLMIAQGRAEIIDIKIQLKVEITDPEKLVLTDRVNELKTFIAAINTQKAALRLELKTELT